MTVRMTRRAASLALGSALLAGVAPARSQTAKRTLRLSAANNKGHPQILGAERFADIVKQKSDGRIDVRVFPGGSLGPDLQNISAMQGGTLDFNVGNATLLAGNAKEMSVLDFPFLFNTAEEADAIVDGPFGQKLFDKLPEKGLVGLAYWELGFRHFHTRSHPIRSADDFKGRKIRVIPTPIYVDFVNALGANAVPMPFTETYTALEQGAIDGMTNPLINIVDGKFHEVSKYLTISNHMYNPQWIGISKRTWDKLSDEEKGIIKAAAVEAGAVQRKLSREAAASALDELKRKGMEVIELPAGDLARLRDMAKPVIEKYKKSIGEELVAELHSEIDRFRSKT